MAPDPRQPAALYAPWAASWRWTLGLILLITLCRVAYLAWFCPYTLLEDEAHYWEWSRHLDWSYYSKGPGVAWLIAASTSIFGNIEFGVRLPAALCSAVAALALAALARETSGDKRAGFFTAAVFQLVPMFQSVSLLMTIDMPYAACWSVAAWALWRGLTRSSVTALATCGFAVGVGVAFKHTMLLFLPGALIVTMLAARRSPGAPRASFLLVPLLSLLGLVPNVIWNAQRDWPTIRHLLGHLGVQGGDVAPTQSASGYHYDPTWTLEFIGSQLAMAGPMLILAFLGWRWGSGVGADGAKRDVPTFGRVFLLALAAPIIIFYLIVSFVTEPEGNWALAGYTTLTALAGGAVAFGMEDFTARTRRWQALPQPRPKVGGLRKGPETASQIAWHATLAIGLLAGLVALRLDLLAKLPVVGSRIPLSRIVGADQMAAHVGRLRDELAARDPASKPFIVSQFYGRASQIAFYLPDHPTVYCSGSRMGGRRSQYDLWPHTDLADPSLAGRSAVLLGDAGRSWWWDTGPGQAGGFHRVEPAGKLDGDRKRNREAFLGFEYTPPSPPVPAASPNP